MATEQEQQPTPLKRKSDERDSSLPPYEKEPPRYKYTANTAIACVDYPTSPERKKAKLDADHEQRHRAVSSMQESMEPNQTACLVTRWPPESMPVKDCHVLPDVTKEFLAQRLEWHWKLRHLHVHNSDNSIKLSINLHTYFNSDGFFLLPEDTSIIDEMIASPSPLDVSNRFNRPVYNYTIVPLPTMQEHPMLVYTGSLLPGALNIKKYGVWYFPYVERGAFPSQLKPHFAIFDAGQKLNNLFGRELDQLVEGIDFKTWLKLSDGIRFEDALRDCHKLYVRWAGPYDLPGIGQDEEVVVYRRCRSEPAPSFHASGNRPERTAFVVPGSRPFDWDSYRYAGVSYASPPHSVAEMSDHGCSGSREDLGGGFDEDLGGDFDRYSGGGFDEESYSDSDDSSAGSSHEGLDDIPEYFAYLTDCIDSWRSNVPSGPYDDTLMETEFPS